jgi:hypothetical protein
MKRVKLDLTPELEKQIIEAWHSKVPKVQICNDLGTTPHLLDSVWGKMRKAGQIPNQRRPGFGGRKPGVMERGLRMPSFAALQAVEKTERIKRREACDQLLALLHEHHGDRYRRMMRARGA